MLKLPVLEDIRIAKPCNADWDDMSGDERVRFCGKCEKNVYNLSAMSRSEAEELVREKEGRMCVRLYQRQDGTVLTADCPVGVKKARLRQRVWASLTSAAASLMIVFGVGAGTARADLTLEKGKKHARASHVRRDPPRPVVPPPPPPMMGEPMPMAKMGDMAPEPVQK